MNWLEFFVKVKTKSDYIDTYKFGNGWEVVFFDKMKRARLIFDSEIRFKSVEFDNLKNLFTLFCHDPVFRAEVADKLDLKI
jgi:hypothetical protein